MAATAKQVLRTFGCLQWECVTANSHWRFENGWGEYNLRRYNNRGQQAGWHLDGPDDLVGEWMGLTLTEAALASQEPILAANPSKATKNR